MTAAPLPVVVRADYTTPMESEIARARRERGDEGVRELLEATFRRCDTAAQACDLLGMARITRPGGYEAANVSSLKRAADRAGVAWPFTRRGKPPRRGSQTPAEKRVRKGSQKKV